jgi:hypothetical protein
LIKPTLGVGANPTSFRDTVRRPIQMLTLANIAAPSIVAPRPKECYAVFRLVRR